MDKDKYTLFNEWCKENGIVCPKLEYPAEFEFGLIGVRAKEDIDYREAFLFVPFNVMISVDFVRKHPKIGPIIKKYPKLFTDKHDDFE